MALKIQNTRRFLRDVYTYSIESRYKQNILNSDKVVTGNLIDSIKVRYRTSGYIIDIYLDELNYGYWVNNGRKAGRFPPVDAMLDFVRLKPIMAKPDKKGKLPTEKQLAFLVGRSIAEKGFNGVFAIDDALASTRLEYQDELNSIFASDMIAEIGDEFKKIRNVRIG